MPPQSPIKRKIARLKIFFPLKLYEYYFQAFDNHLNMILSDVEETYLDEELDKISNKMIMKVIIWQKLYEFFL